MTHMHDCVGMSRAVVLLNSMRSVDAQIIGWLSPQGLLPLAAP